MAEALPGGGGRANPVGTGKLGEAIRGILEGVCGEASFRPIVRSNRDIGEKAMIPCGLAD